jgi:hypothetical protein
MSHETIIFSALKGFVSNRCYPDTFPQEPAIPVWPAIRYTQIGGTIDEDVCGSGTAETDNSEFQIDIVAATATARATLRDQVRTAMLGLSIPNALTLAPIHEFDAETKTYRCIMRFVIYGSSL